MSNELVMKVEGWDILQKKLEALGADVVEKQKEALIEARNDVNGKLRTHMKNSHYDTGELHDSIIDYPPIANENGVSIFAGFDFSKGGWKSRFLLAGTKVRGTPHEPKDQKLWNILYSNAEKLVRKNIMLKYLREAVRNFGR